MAEIQLHADPVVHRAALATVQPEFKLYADADVIRAEHQSLNYRYDPGIFDRSTIEEARSIILTATDTLTSDDRWDRETDWLATKLVFAPDALIIDYGCGIGRMAERLHGAVLGVDISAPMRALATMQLTQQPGFSAVTPAMLKHLVDKGLRADGALAVWVLQHCYNPAQDIALLASALRPGASLWVVNAEVRLVPGKDDADQFHWLVDSYNVFQLLTVDFELMSSQPLPPEMDQAGGHLRHYERR